MEERTQRRLLKKGEVLKRIPFSESTLWREIRHDRFPSPIYLAEKTVVWIEDEIDAWIAQRAADRDAPEPAAIKPWSQRAQAKGPAQIEETAAGANADGDSVFGRR